MTNDRDFQAKIDLYRQKIDQTDKKIIWWLSRRQKFVEKIGVIKKRNGVPPLDKKRWRKVMESRILLASKVGLDKIVIKKIFEIIHKYSLSIEKK